MGIDWNELVIGPTIRIFGESKSADGGRRRKTIEYTSQTAGTFPIDGVFDEAYLELTPLGRGGIDSEAMSLGYPGAITTEMPVLGVQLSEFAEHRANPEQGDLLRVRDETYVVKEVRPDGHGYAKLLLNTRAVP
jgi:hypothetical protein